MTSHIKKRGSTYYAQLAVPIDLQPVFRRKTMDRSLSTKDGATAKRLLPDVLKTWHVQFDDARRGVALAAERAPTLSAAAKAHFASELAADDHERLAGQPASELRKLSSAHNAPRLRMIAAGKITGDEAEAYVGYAADALADNGQAPAISRAELLRAMAEVQLDAMAQFEARDDGRLIVPELKSALLTTLEPEAPKPGESIMELYDKYARENAKGISQDTLNQGKRDVKLFAETVGNPAPSNITPRLVGVWKDLLLEYPVKAAEIAAFKGMTMRQVIKANEKIGKPKISDRTVNRCLSALGAFCDWLVRRGYLERNPVAGMHQSVDKTKRTTCVFSSAQLNTLFRSPLFTGCRGDDDWQRPGNFQVRDYRYWLPLVMLYSGARPAEIAQLLVADVRQEHGTWIMHITEEGDDDKSVKTKGSMRVVPVHSELIRLGFIKYRETMAEAGTAKLFPNATRNKRGQMVADFSRDFGRYLTRLDIKDGRGLSLYSLRHGFVDALRRAEYLDEQFGFLVGHTKHTMTGQYGMLPQGMLRQRVELVNSIAYPGLDISHLGL